MPCGLPAARRSLAAVVGRRAQELLCRHEQVGQKFAYVYFEGGSDIERLLGNALG
jgi:hypothetical protein